MSTTNNNETGEGTRKRSRSAGADQNNGDDQEENRDQSLNARVCRTLKCIICITVPSPREAFMCRTGHIMCEQCATRLMALATLAGQLAECPDCRVPFNWNALLQNKVIEQTIWELDESCANCNTRKKIRQLEEHLETDCPKRIVDCKYRSLGCTWKCSFDVMAEHEAQCDCRNMNAHQLVEALRNFKTRELVNFQQEIHGFLELSAERLSYLNLDLEIVNSELIGENRVLNLQSRTVQIYNKMWRLKIRLEENANVGQGFTYSLMLTEDPDMPILVKYFLVLVSKGLRGQSLCDTKCQINEHLFTDAFSEGLFKTLPITSPNVVYSLIAMPVIQVRLWMSKQL